MLLLIISEEKKYQPSFRLSKILVNPLVPFQKIGDPPQKNPQSLTLFSFFFFFFCKPMHASDERRSRKPFANALQARERP